MSLDIRATRFLTNTSTGTQDITISGFGTPKAVMFYLSNSQSGSEVINGAIIGLGATDGTNNWCFAETAQNAQASSITTRTQSQSSCIAFPNLAGASLEGEAVFDSWITDGIKINWTNGMDTAKYIVAVFYGGSDIENVTVGVGTAASSNNSSVTITTGHPNDLVFFSCVGLSSPGSNIIGIFNMGMAIDDGSDTQRQMAISSPYDEATTILSQDVRTDSVMGQLHNSSWTWYGEVDNFTSNSFDVITRNGSSGSDDFGYIAFDFSENVEKSLTTIDSPTSPGNEETAGIGFEPGFLMLFGSSCIAVNTIQTTDIISFNISIINGNEEFSIGIQDEDAVGTTNTQSICDDVAITYDSDDGAAFFDATLTSFDADGWTLNYSVADGTIRKFVGLALGVAGGGNVYNVSIAESTGLSETQAVNLTMPITIAETLGLADAQTITLDLTAAVSETIGMSETQAITLDIPVAVSESIGLTDTQTALMDLIISIAESVGLSDVQSIGAAIHNVSVTESIGLSETQTGKFTLVISVNESIGLAETQSTIMTFAAQIAESIGLSDIVTSGDLANGKVCVTISGAGPTITIDGTATTITITGSAPSAEITGEGC